MVLHALHFSAGRAVEIAHVEFRSRQTKKKPRHPERGRSRFEEEVGRAHSPAAPSPTERKRERSARGAR
jgi:hypothetical protein